MFRACSPTRVQGKEIRIVWMAAIYSGASFLSLRFMHAAEYLDSVRSLYEAYCIFNLFGYFLQVGLLYRPVS